MQCAVPVVNSDIKIGGQVIFWKEAFDMGLQLVDDLYDHNNDQVLTLAQISRKFGLSSMQATQLLSATRNHRIHKAWTNSRQQIQFTKREIILKSQSKSNKISKIMYYLISEKEAPKILKRQVQYWDNKFSLAEQNIGQIASIVTVVLL